MSKYDFTKNLAISEVWPVSKEVIENGGIGIDWSSDAGWGQLVLYWGTDGKLRADTEHICTNEDKTFMKAVLNLLADEIIVDER